MVYQLPSTFPTTQHSNIGFYVVGAGSAVPFGVLMPLIAEPPRYGAGSGGQLFPRWTYAKAKSRDGQYQPGTDFDVNEWDYRRIDNVTDAILSNYRAAFDEEITKDDIFYYTYGLPRSSQYRETSL